MENNEIQSQEINSYLTFKLGEEYFASHVSNVLNILELVKITEVPMAPPYMKGVINLRGSVLPVVDTRIKFGLSEIEFTKNTCIIVINVDISGDKVSVGALVDSVQEVLEVDQKQILPPPSIGAKYKSEFITGMIKMDNNFIMVLNLDKVFSTDELSILQDTFSDVVVE